MADSCVFVERDVLEIGRRPRMNDSHTCDICGEVRACGLLCKCERGETSKATELAALKAEVAALKAKVERQKAAIDADTGKPRLVAGFWASGG